MKYNMFVFLNKCICFKNNKVNNKEKELTLQRSNAISNPLYSVDFDV